MNNIPSLFRISQEQQLLNEMLFEADGELTPELEEALAINEQNLTIKAEGYITSMSMFAASAEAAKNEVRRLQAFIKRSENAQERMKTALAGALDTFGIEKLEVGTHRLSFRKSEGVVIQDESLLPDRFRIIEIKTDKAAIKAELKSGIAVPGACLEKRRNLQIK